MPDANFEPESLGELTRYLQYIVGGIEKQLSELSDKVDRLDVVSREQYRADLTDIRTELRDKDTEISQLGDKLTAQNRWIIGSIIYPLIGFGLTLFAVWHGGTPVK